MVKNIEAVSMPGVDHRYMIINQETGEVLQVCYGPLINMCFPS